MNRRAALSTTFAFALGAAGALALASCVRVRAHQRETLSKPALVQPAVPSQDAAEQHVFQIREGTTGAVGGGGGGCGCN